MAKGSGGRKPLRPSEPFFCWVFAKGGSMQKGKKKPEKKKRVIASRKACDAKGTGLSHYVLMDKKGK